MSGHHGGVRWARTSDTFTYDTYNRAHTVTFKDGAIVVPGSANPAFRGDAERMDPEEAYVASLAACHMLTFLAICARKHLTLIRTTMTPLASWRRAPTASCGSLV